MDGLEVKVWDDSVSLHAYEVDEELLSRNVIAKSILFP